MNVSGELRPRRTDVTQTAKILLNYPPSCFMNDIAISTSGSEIELNVEQVRPLLQHFASEPAIDLSLPFVGN